MADQLASSLIKAGTQQSSISIRVRWEGLAELQRRLMIASRLSPLATARALNHTAGVARTQVGRTLVKQTGMPYRRVRQELSISRATKTNLSAAVVARGGYSGLRDFRPRQVKAGISAAPWNRREIFEGAFIIKKYGGHIYGRKGDARLPIKKLYGPALPVEMTRGQSEADFHRVVESELEKRLEHELRRALGF